MTNFAAQKECIFKMKRLVMATLLSVICLAVSAIPAKRGWYVLTLADGTEVKAQLTGDEHLHYWLTEDGRRLSWQGERLEETDIARMQQKAASRRAVRETASAARRAVSMGEHTSYKGQKRGLVILAQFTDVKFKTANNQAKYQKIMNAENYTTSEGFVGSVADYFRAQSGGLFEIAFDVVGPYTLSNNQKYYGENDEDGYDMRAHEMIVEGCRLAEAEVDFADYDWDGDGEADQVYVIYAGKGEADGGSSVANTVWPHMWTLYDAMGETLTLDGIMVNTYACSNEIDRDGHIEGIGSICHEFSHCLGYPDIYDTLGDNYAMGSYDLMSGGNYNGDSFVPAGYSAYEKWMAGWIDLTPLSAESVSESSLKPVSEGGEGYIIYNDGHPDEYFIVENRQLTNWDAELPGHGLMVTQVDFDEDIWEWNIPNAFVTESESKDEDGIYYGFPANDHLRLTILTADNKPSYYSEQNDLFPYGKKDSLTYNSKPAARFYNDNLQGTRRLPGSLHNIAENADGTMRFDYVADDVASGIHSAHITSNSTLFFDLYGRRIQMPRKGLYIRNQKKFLPRK